VAIAVFAAIRFHLRHIPLDRDDGEYAYMGQLILEGVPPYKLAANMKLPGTYAAYAAIMAVFGQTTAGIHTGVIVVTSLSAIFLFLIGKRLYGPLTGGVGAASYIFFAAKPVVLGIDGHATHFIDVMALAGMWLLVCAMPPNPTSADPQEPRHQIQLGLLFAAGLCFRVVIPDEATGNPVRLLRRDLLVLPQPETAAENTDGGWRGVDSRHPHTLRHHMPYHAEDRCVP
jgi:hypothetical protein